MDVHPTIDILTSCGRDATVRVWDMRTKACIHSMTGHTNTVAEVRCQAADPQVRLNAVINTDSIFAVYLPTC